MPLSAAQRDQAVRTALSHIGMSRGQASDSELYTAVARRLGAAINAPGQNVPDLSTNLSISAAVQSARRIVAYGQALHFGQPLPFQRPPVDPTAYEGPWRYVYRVKVVYTDPTTGERHDTVIPIRSDMPLDRTTILLEARDVAANTRMEELSPGRGKPDIVVNRIISMMITTGGRMG